MERTKSKGDVMCHRVEFRGVSYRRGIVSILILSILIILSGCAGTYFRSEARLNDAKTESIRLDNERKKQENEKRELELQILRKQAKEQK